MFEKELEEYYDRCLMAHVKAFPGAESEKDYIKMLPQMEKDFMNYLLNDVIPDFDEDSIDEFKEWIEDNDLVPWDAEDNIKFLVLFILKWKIEAMILQEVNSEH